MDFKYPYTDYHELNLDWFLSEFKNLVETWARTQQDWISMQEYIRDYFDNLNVQTEIDNKINAMILDGTFGNIVEPFVTAALPALVAGQLPDVVAAQIGAVVAAQIGAVVADQLPAVAAAAAAAEVGDWLSAHIDPDTGYVIDDTLTVSQAAADSKTVGDNITVINNNMMHLIADSTDFTYNGYISPNGILISHNSYRSTDYVIIDSHKFRYDRLYVFDACNIALYDENYTLVYAFRPSDTASLTYVSGNYLYNGAVKYARFCTNYADVSNAKVYLYDDVKYDIIDTDNITDDAITHNKTQYVIHNPATNFINSWKDNTYINSSGNESSFEGFYASNYIEILDGYTYYKDNLYLGYYAFYDEDYVCIEGHGNDSSLTNPINIPVGAKYARFTITTAAQRDTAWISTQNIQPPSYKYMLDDTFLQPLSNNDHCNYNGNEISIFNKIACIGDSLTAGVFNYNEGGNPGYYTSDKYAFPAYISKLTGVNTDNLGVGGYTSAEWYDAYEETTLSGYDAAIIQLGVNDQIRYSEFGNTSKTAFANIISKLKSENKQIQIFIANIIPATSYSSSGFLTFSENLTTWINSNYESDSQITMLDMQQYGNTKKSPAYNNGHLSALGYQRLAQDYVGYISYEIANDLNRFRQVQFAGTDHSYTS